MYAVVGVLRWWAAGCLLFFCFLWRCVQAVGHTFFLAVGVLIFFPLVYILYRLSIVSLSSLYRLSIVSLIY